MYTREKFSRSFSIPNSRLSLHVRQAVTYPSESVRCHINNFPSSRSFASCSSSFQLVQSRSFRSASTILLHAKTSDKCSLKNTIFLLQICACLFCVAQVYFMVYVWLWGSDYQPMERLRSDMYVPFFPYWRMMSVMHVMVLIKKLYFAKWACAIRFVIPPWTVSGFQRLL